MSENILDRAIRQIAESDISVEEESSLVATSEILKRVVVDTFATFAVAAEMGLAKQFSRPAAKDICTLLIAAVKAGRMIERKVSDGARVN